MLRFPLLLLAVAFGVRCGSSPDVSSVPPGQDSLAIPSAADTVMARAPSGCLLVEEGYGPQGALDVRAETVVDGLEVPWGLALLPDGRMLVTERPGRLRLVDDGQLVAEPVATVDTGASAEGGLLGLALHPDFSTNRLFYLYVTTSAGGALQNRVERWRLADDARSATRDRVLLDGIPAARFHNGGRLRIGPDRMLYVGTGDARRPETAQDPDQLAGKVLRLGLDGSIPSDNPFPGSPVFLLGVRNTQGFAWPDATTLWVTDHGPSGEMGRRAHDEVNVAQAGDNLGWPPIYGCQEQDGLVTPVISWDTAVPPGGADIYTGSAIPDWQGDLIVGTLGSEHLHRFVFSDTPPYRLTSHDVYLDGAESQGRLREVLMAPDGHLYVTTSNCDGRGSCPPSGDEILRLTR